MKIAVIGLGSIGSRHVDNLLALGHTDLMGYDVREMRGETRLPVVDRMEALRAWKPDYALVCTPPVEHAWQAVDMLGVGAHVFVEKPLTTKAADAALLVEMAERFGRTLAVGYMLRAHKPLQDLKENAYRFCAGYLWCYWNMGLKTYAQDLVAETSHELDLALWLFGPAKVEHKVRLKADGIGEYGARVHLLHDDGRRTEVRMLGNEERYFRGVEVVFEKAVAPFPRKADITYGPADLTPCYTTELQAFLKGQPLCTGQEGLAVMKLLEQLK